MVEYKHPSAPACFLPPPYTDFGPPADCDNPLPHHRMSWVTSVTVSSSSAMLVTVPIVGYEGRDAEDAAETPSPGFEVTVWRHFPK